MSEPYRSIIIMLISLISLIILLSNVRRSQRRKKVIALIDKHVKEMEKQLIERLQCPVCYSIAARIDKKVAYCYECETYLPVDKLIKPGTIEIK